MQNFKLVIEYEGTNYHGWQVQSGLLTIQGIIEEKLSQIVQEKVTLIASGRTDAGVHAFGQTAHFKTNTQILPFSIQRALNGMLPKDIVIKMIEAVPLDFHARYNSKSKVYKYSILNRKYPSALKRNVTWFMPYALDIELIKEAGKLLVGEHDFSSFRASACGAKSPIRTLMRLDVIKNEELIDFYFEADGFLHHMVRNIVGTLVDVGRKKLNKEDVKHILSIRDRTKAGLTAPPSGLCLMEVKY